MDYRERGARMAEEENARRAGRAEGREWLEQQANQAYRVLQDVRDGKPAPVGMTEWLEGYLSRRD
jgi:hypothetical protein